MLLSWALQREDLFASFARTCRCLCQSLAVCLHACVCAYTPVPPPPHPPHAWLQTLSSSLVPRESPLPVTPGLCHRKWLTCQEAQPQMGAFSLSLLAGRLPLLSTPPSSTPGQAKCSAHRQPSSPLSVGLLL